MDINEPQQAKKQKMDSSIINQYYENISSRAGGNLNNFHNTPNFPLPTPNSIAAGNYLYSNSGFNTIYDNPNNASKFHSSGSRFGFHPQAFSVPSTHHDSYHDAYGSHQYMSHHSGLPPMQYNTPGYGTHIEHSSLDPHHHHHHHQQNQHRSFQKENSPPPVPTHQTQHSPPFEPDPPPITGVTVGNPGPGEVVLQGTLIMQPGEYQVSNYNIHPAPAIALSEPLKENCVFYASLIELKNNTIVDKGFQSGESRTLPAGLKLIYFTGLKLNKMGPIKMDLQQKQIKYQDLLYCVQFVVGSKQWRTRPFRLVSSCSQLPSRYKEMRPTKKRNGTIPSFDANYALLDAAAQAQFGAESGTSPKRVKSGSDDEEEEEEPSEIRSEMTRVREELEKAISNGDGPTAAKCAQRLAALTLQSKEQLIQSQLTSTTIPPLTASSNASTTISIQQQSKSPQMNNN